MNRVTNTAQLELVKLLQAKSYVAQHSQVFVSSKNGGPTNVIHDAEPSQRTRSIVFMALGAIVGRRSGFHKVLYMAENGQMAIHLPLSGGRIGAFSTHTAHPSVLAKMQTFLSSSLGIEFTLVNPYVYLTKGEVVSHVVKNLPEGIPVSTSCWKNARLASHCGECVPCLIRRIALESTGGDSTKYERDLFSEDIATLHEEDDGRRNFSDISELVSRFAKGNTKELVDEFPDLISADFGADMAVQMYKRFSHEAITVLKKYPKLGPFLQ